MHCRNPCVFFCPQVFFIESICDDPDIIAANIKVNSASFVRFGQVTYMYGIYRMAGSKFGGLASEAEN